MNSNSRPAVTVSGPIRTPTSPRSRPRLERLEGREMPAIGLSSTAPWVSEGPTVITDGQVVASATSTTTTLGSVIGAIDAIYASRTTAGLMFAGGPNGGVWRTTNGTAASPTWTPISDDQASLSVTDISIDPNSDSRVLVGIGGSADGGYRFQTYRDATGNVNPIPTSGVVRGDLIGPLFTTNALAANPTWRVLSQLAGQEITKVFVRSNILLVATNTGVYQSTDDGASFTLRLPGRVFDLAEDPGNPNRFYAATKPAGVNTTPVVWRTDDGGFNWGDVSDTTQYPGTFTAGQMKLNANTVNIKITVYNQNNINGDVVYVAVVNDAPPPLDTQITNLNAINTLPFPNNAQGRGAQLASVVWSTNQGGNWTRMDIPRYLGGLQAVGGAGSSINNGVVTMTSRHRLQTGDQIYMRNADNNINPDPMAPDTVPPIQFFGNNNAVDANGVLQTPELWYVRVTSETAFEIGAVPPLQADGTPNPAFTPFGTGTATPTSNPPGFSGLFQLAQGINMGERGEFLDIVADPTSPSLVYLTGSSPYSTFNSEVGSRTFTANVFRGNRDVTAAPPNGGNFYVSNQWIPLTNNPGPGVAAPSYPPPNTLPPGFDPFNGTGPSGLIDTRNPGGGFNWGGRPTSPWSEPTLNPNRGGNPAWSNPPGPAFARPNYTSNGSAPPADPREITFDATGQLILATGGGLYRQTTPTGITGNWVNINGTLGVTAAWSAAYDAISKQVIIGTQDTSGAAQTASGSGTYKSAFTLAQMGSTFDQSNVYTVQVDNVSRAGLNQSVRYYIGGNFGNIIRQVVNAAGTVVSSAALTFGGPATPGNAQSGLAGTDPSGSWLGENQPAISMILNSQDPRRALYGSTQLYEDSDPIGDSGNVVNRVTPPAMTGRVSAVAYGGRRNGTPFNQIAFAGTTTGQLWRRGEFGVTFTNINTGALAAVSGVVDDIAVDPDDWRHVFVAKAGRVFETTNADAASPTWVDKSENLVGPPTADGTAGPGFQTTEIRTIALWDPNAGSTNGGVVLVAGGRGGVYRLSVDPICLRTNWTEYGSGMPNSVVTDLSFVGNRLTAATFGRGVYSIADVSATLGAPVTLLVTGDGGNNAMTVTAHPTDPNAVIVTDGLGTSGTFLLSQFDKIQFDGLGGADSIVVGSNGESASSSLDFVRFAVEVNAGGQVNDVLILHGVAGTGGRKVTVTGTTVGATAGDHLFGTCGYVLYSGLNQGGMFLRTGTGSDVVAFAAEVMPRNFDLNGGAGNEVYQFDANTSGVATITDAIGSDTVVVNGTVAVENYVAATNAVFVNTLAAVYAGGAVRNLILSGNLALDSLTAVGSAGNDAFLVRQTASGGFTLTGQPAAITATAVEGITVNGNGGVDTLNYEDRTGGTYGTVANPAGGAVYRPTGSTSGTFTVAGGGVTNLGFVNIVGSFGANGDPTNTGGRDVLTVLGFTTAGLAPSFGEATIVNGSDIVTASDTQVAITNVAFGEVRPINMAVGSNGKSTYSTVFVRTGNEAGSVGDTVTAVPTLRTNLVIDGGDPTAGPNQVIIPGDKITVNVNGARTTTQVNDPALGPPQTRVTQTVNQASVGFLNFEPNNKATIVDVGGGSSPPPPPAAPIFAVGTQPGVAGVVLVYDARTGAEKFGPIAPFPGFTGGLRVATADFNGDGVTDFAVAAGPGGGPAVKVYDGSTGAEISSFFPFEAGFRGGVSLALGDVNGDGFADLIFGAGPGGGPRVKVVSGQGQNTLQDFFAYDAGFRGGVNVGAGDVNGDGLADIIIGALAGGGPHVRAVDGQSLQELASFFAFDAGFRGGVNVAAGDITGDGAADFVVGAGNGGGPHVKVFNGRGQGEIRSFFVNDPDTGGAPPIALSSGVSVAAVDQDGDGLFEVVTGRGAGARPFAQIFRVSQISGGVVVPTLLNTLAVNTLGDAYSGGIFVG